MALRDIEFRDSPDPFEGMEFYEESTRRLLYFNLEVVYMKDNDLAEQ